MQLTNQPTFKATDISERGLYILRDRLPDYNFEIFLEKYTKAFKDTDCNICLYKSQKSKKRLQAKIKYDENNTIFIKESFFSYIFNKPFNFIEKIKKQIKKDLTAIAQNQTINT